MATKTLVLSWTGDILVKKTYTTWTKCGYEFVIMMKGMKELVKSLVLEVKGTFEEDRRYSIRDYKVSGITVKKQLYPSDEKERYFHIFYNDRKKSSEHEAIEAKIDRMAECLHQHEGTKYEIKGGASPGTLI